MIATFESEKRSSRPPSRDRKGRRFHFGDGAGPETRLAVVSVRHDVGVPDYTFGGGCPDWYAIAFVSRGRGALALDGTCHPLIAGTVVSCGPGRPRPATCRADDALEVYSVDFTGPAAHHLLAARGLSPGTVARVSRVSEVEDVFDSLIRDGSRGSVAATSLCAVLLEYLLIKMADLVVPTSARVSAADGTFHRCRRYIARHFRRLRSLEQIAEECEIDRAYLCRLFRRFGHPAPYRYLLRLKMRDAADQLRDRKRLVKDVAASVGFEDPFQFSHTFKNVLGASPDVFRRLHEPSP
jgi:AraC-like DNA-binding protein